MSGKGHGGLSDCVDATAAVPQIAADLPHHLISAAMGGGHLAALTLNPLSSQSADRFAALIAPKLLSLSVQA